MDGVVMAEWLARRTPNKKIVTKKKKKKPCPAQATGDSCILLYEIK